MSQAVATLITQKLLSEPPTQYLAAMLHRSMCKQSTLAPAVRRHEQLANVRYAGKHPRALARRQARAVGCHKLVVMPASQLLAQTRPPLRWRLLQTLASVLRVPGKQQHGTCAQCAALLWHGSTCTWAWTPSRHKYSVLCASMWPCRGATGCRCYTEEPYGSTASMRLSCCWATAMQAQQSRIAAHLGAMQQHGKCALSAGMRRRPRYIRVPCLPPAPARRSKPRPRPFIRCSLRRARRLCLHRFGLHASLLGTRRQCSACPCVSGPRRLQIAHSTEPGTAACTAMDHTCITKGVGTACYSGLKKISVITLCRMSLGRPPAAQQVLVLCVPPSAQRHMCALAAVLAAPQAMRAAAAPAAAPAAASHSRGHQAHPRAAAPCWSRTRPAQLPLAERQSRPAPCSGLLAAYGSPPLAGLCSPFPAAGGRLQGLHSIPWLRWAPLARSPHRTPCLSLPATGWRSTSQALCSPQLADDKHPGPQAHCLCLRLRLPGFLPERPARQRLCRTLLAVGELLNFQGLCSRLPVPGDCRCCTRAGAASLLRRQWCCCCSPRCCCRCVWDGARRRAPPALRGRLPALPSPQAAGHSVTGQLWSAKKLGLRRYASKLYQVCGVWLHDPDRGLPDAL